ncbi:MAG: AAA family ATPase [Lachnospiraceae bacterium]|nr:AAA family ATPase [Lachnospiraceae bacterium]
MKLLRVTAEGLPLFKGKLDLVFYAKQRIEEEHKEVLYPLFSNVYLNSANGFIGINASGKTSVLKVILLVLEMINNEPINHIETRDILGNEKEVKLNTYFFSGKANEICRLETIITSKQSKTEGISYSIVSESMWTKNIDEIATRKAMLDFGGREPVMIRSGREEFLSDDVSIMIARNKKTKEHVHIVNLLKYTNMNVLPFSEDIPSEVITFLDPTIESLHFDEKDKKPLIHLKFKGKEEILLNNPVELNNYLSSGTVKGMITFTLAREVLQSGGYIVVDEVENHFNKEIVTTLVRFFMDSKLNKNGGTLIFSTHYPELLDEYERNDGIFITRNRNGITVENLSNILKRNDIKKSDAYQSGFLEGTTPTYEAYMQLKKSIVATLA